MIHGYGFAVLTEDSVADLGASDIELRTTNQWIYHSRMYEAAKLVARREDLDLNQRDRPLSGRSLCIYELRENDQRI